MDENNVGKKPIRITENTNYTENKSKTSGFSKPSKYSKILLLIFKAIFPGNVHYNFLSFNLFTIWGIELTVSACNLGFSISGYTQVPVVLIQTGM